MSKKITYQDLADSTTNFFHVALQIADTPSDLQVLLNLVDEIKKARAADMINGTAGRAFQSLYEKFVIDNVQHAADELAASDQLDDT